MVFSQYPNTALGKRRQTASTRCKQRRRCDLRAAPAQSCGGNAPLRNGVQGRSLAPGPTALLRVLAYNYLGGAQYSPSQPVASPGLRHDFSRLLRASVDLEHSFVLRGIEILS